jgi:acyl carrier protein
MPSPVPLLDIINQVNLNKRRPSLTTVHGAMRLREDIGFDSLDLAELTVRIEEATGVDVFAAGLVKTIGELEARIEDGLSAKS